MIGGMGEPFSEHARTPVLKFIDFGMAKERAISLGENLRKATMVCKSAYHPPAPGTYLML